MSTSLMKIDLSSELQKLKILEDDPKYSSLGSKAGKFAYFLNTGYKSDISFFIGTDKKEFKVHKTILMMNSSVFAQLFHENESLKQIWIEDTEESHFNSFLNYCYTGILDIQKSEIIPLLKLSTKFDVRELMDKCNSLLPDIVDIENALQIYEQAVKFNLTALQQIALDFICEKAFLIFEKSGIEDISMETWKAVLVRSDLAAESEIQIFTALLKWGKSECLRQKMPPNNPKYLRSVIEECLKLIRFPNMTPEEMSLKVATESILTMEEIMSNLLYFNVSQINKQHIGPGLFSAEQRDYYVPEVRSDIILLENFNKASNPLSFGTNNHFISFSVSRRISIAGVGLNYSLYSNNSGSYNYSYNGGSRSAAPQHSINIKLIDDGSGKVLQKTKDPNIINAITNHIYTSHFENPSILLPTSVYTIRVKSSEIACGLGLSNPNEKLNGLTKKVIFSENGREAELKIIETNSIIFRHIYALG